MKTKNIFYLSVTALTLTFTSCKKDNPKSDPTIPPTSSGYDNGVFIINQGAYTGGTGTISYYNRSTGSISNDIFYAKNNFPLGNIAQSMELYNGKGYIVVNNAGKIEVVDGSSFASSGTITGLTYPRFFLGIDNSKAYVTEWGASGVAGAVKVINLSNNTVSSTITTGKGAETMVKSGNFVYVACSGGFDTDSVVTVINSTTNAVVTNINVGANPKYIKADNNGKIWVLCYGQWDAAFSYLIKTGSLVRIDVATNMVDLTLPFSSVYSQPSNLVINSAKSTLYYCYNSQVYSQSTTSASLDATMLINRNFYGLGIDPTNNYFFGADAGDYTSDGWVLRYTPTGTVVDSVKVGIIPGDFFFK